MKFLATFLAFIILAQPAVSFGGQDVRSVAVQPLMDGNSDEASRELATALGDALRTSTRHHIVDSNVAANVTGYQGGEVGASPQLTEAETLIAEAKKHYFNFQYKDAEVALGNAISILESSSNLHGTAPLLLDAYLSRALIANSRRNKDDARSSLFRALDINPILVLNEEDYPPSIISLFDDVKSTRSAASKGSLFVTSRPEGADVLLNGIKQGSAPLSLNDLPAGEYSVAVRANRYAPEQRDVAIAANQRAEAKFRLRWAKGAGRRSKGEASDAAAAVREGVRIADMLKVDKTVLVDADLSGNGSFDVAARTVDRTLRAGFKPSVVKGVRREQGGERFAELASKVADQIEADASSDPASLLDPVGEGDPSLLGKRKKPLVKRPLFWGTLGVVVAGAVAGGILASMSGGSETGTIKMSFK